MSKSIVVTGGAGFVGSHLCRQLVHRGDTVICVDNLYSGSRSNISDLIDYKNFEFVRHDVSLPLVIEVDQIYNLACPASPVHYQADPIQTMKTSVHGAINMLGLAKRTNARILQASTSEIYGNPIIHPQTEDYHGNVNPIGIRACYDEGKRSAETLFFDYHRRHDVDIRVARIFNTFGPFMQIDDGRVVSNFITQAIKGEDLTVYGDGSQTRSFCYVSDLVNGLIALMERDAVFVPVNLGNPDERTVSNLANLVIEMTGSTSNLTMKPMPADDPIKRQPDITRAKELLGWHPVVDIESGLQQTIEYFQGTIDTSKYIR